MFCDAYLYFFITVGGGVIYKFYCSFIYRTNTYFHCYFLSHAFLSISERALANTLLEKSKLIAVVNEILLFSMILIFISFSFFYSPQCLSTARHKCICFYVCSKILHSCTLIDREGICCCYFLVCVIIFNQCGFLVGQSTILVCCLQVFKAMKSVFLLATKFLYYCKADC